MPDTNFFSDSIQFSIGNTDFQIVFSPKDFAKLGHNSSPEHYHLFCECQYIKRGEMLLGTPSQTFVLRENTFAIIPPNVKHSTKIVSDEAERMVFYVVTTKNEKDKNNTFLTYEPLFFSEVPYVHENAAAMFDPVLYYTQLDMASKFLYELKLKNLFELIFIRLLEQNISSVPMTKAKESVGSKKELKHKIADFMLDNFLLYARLEDLADRLHLSTRQTDRILKQLFHKNFQEIKTAKRIETAKLLMRNPANSMKTISEMVGYGSYTGFYETFKNYTGMSPDEFRQKIDSIT